MADELRIEQRIQNMKKFYVQAGALIDKLPESIPNNVKGKLKDAILGDKDLKALMDGIDSKRPPRVFLIGRTGVGKSSLINALCGSYVADVCDTHSCTAGTETYKCMDGERVLMEICDTRGIAESEGLSNRETAEEMMIHEISEFSPDVAILVLGCTHRDDINSDVAFLKKLATSYQEVNGVKLPIVAVINKCDEMAPGRIKEPNQYPASKKEKINEVIQYYKRIIMNGRLSVESVVAVSSYIEWMTPDGMEISVDEINALPNSDINNLQMSFDGRYQIEELLRVLEHAILDVGAQMGLRMAVRLSEVVNRLSNHLITIFSGIAGTIALTPIPVSDVYILLILQATLVALIASLSGRDISLETAKEFILSMGGIAGLGYAFRLAAQQAAKFLNLVWPGSGSAVSAGIAGLGTAAMGKAAIEYYINGTTLEDAKKKFEEERNKRV